MQPDQHRLPFTTVLAFAGVGIPLAAIGLPMAVFVAPLYANELGLGTALTGLIFMLLRFWDLITDPIMGWLVDTKPSRYGRVKHWLAISVPVLMLAGFFLFLPNPVAVSPLYLAVWLGVFWLGFTLLQTPHQSWVPLITRTYDERSRLFLWREVLSTGTLLALLIIPALLALYAGMDRLEQVQVMGVILLIALPVTVGLALRLVPDVRPGANDPKVSFDWPQIRRAFGDTGIQKLLIAEVAVGIAIASTGGTFLFAAQWGFGVTGLAPVILLFFFIAGFAAMPLWVALSKRTEKHTALIAVCGFSALAYPLYFPLSQIGGGAPALFLAALVSGLGYGTPFVLMRSMMADLIEREQARTGTNRAGLYYSLMSAAYKPARALPLASPICCSASSSALTPAETIRRRLRAGLCSSLLACRLWLTPSRRWRYAAIR